MIKRCFIIGRGASLEGFDFSVLDGEYKISINGFHGNPNAIVFLDNTFTARNLDALINFKGDIYTCKKSKYIEISEELDTGQRIHEIYLREGSRDNSSGISAIEVALDLAEKIYLLGYDFKYTNGKTYFDKKESHVCYKNDGWLSRRLRRFEELPKNRIFNCNKDSSITCFEFVSLQDVIVRGDDGLGTVKEN